MKNAAFFNNDLKNLHLLKLNLTVLVKNVWFSETQKTSMYTTVIFSI